MATDKERFAELLDMQDFQMITSFKQTYVDALKHYYFIGGMPEAVQSFAESKDFNEVREIQKRILAAYEQDFSKHAPNEIVPKIRMLWQDINDFVESESKDRCLISMIWLKQHRNFENSQHQDSQNNRNCADDTRFPGDVIFFGCKFCIEHLS